MFYVLIPSDSQSSHRSEYLKSHRKISFISCHLNVIKVCSNDINHIISLSTYGSLWEEMWSVICVNATFCMGL